MTAYFRDYDGELWQELEFVREGFGWDHLGSITWYIARLPNGLEMGFKQFKQKGA